MPNEWRGSWRSYPFDFLAAYKYLQSMQRKPKRTNAEIAADKRRTGRPPKSKAEKQSARVMVNLTPAARARLEALARKEGLPLATYILLILREKGN